MSANKSKIQYLTGIQFNKLYPRKWVLIIHRKSCSFIDINGKETSDNVIWEKNLAKDWIEQNNGKNNKWYSTWNVKILDNKNYVKIINDNIIPSNIMIFT